MGNESVSVIGCTDGFTIICSGLGVIGGNAFDCAVVAGAIALLRSQPPAQRLRRRGRAPAHAGAGRGSLSAAAIVRCPSLTYFDRRQCFGPYIGVRVGEASHPGPVGDVEFLTAAAALGMQVQPAPATAADAEQRLEMSMELSQRRSFSDEEAWDSCDDTAVPTQQPLTVAVDDPYLGVSNSEVFLVMEEDQDMPLEADGPMCTVVLELEATGPTSKAGS